MAATQQQLQSLTDEYQRLQQEVTTHVATRQKLESQQQENLGVSKEFDGLSEDANIYKLVGPVLLKQEKMEAVLAVKGRLDFIDGEIKRVEKQIAECQDKSDKRRTEIMQLQSQLQGPPQQQQVGA